MLGATVAPRPEHHGGETQQQRHGANGDGEPTRLCVPQEAERGETERNTGQPGPDPGGEGALVGERRSEPRPVGALVRKSLLGRAVITMFRTGTSVGWRSPPPPR